MPSTSPNSTSGIAAEGSQELSDFIATVVGDRHLRVEESLGDGYVRLRVAEAQRRQAKHDIRCVEDVVIELLRNSRDAGARRILVATGREGLLRTTTVIDDGGGIPAPLHERVFDARVTSKLDSMREDRWGVHGRGMALYSIRENAREAKVMSSGLGLGAAIRVVTCADELSERTDQSSWPMLGTNDDGQRAVVRGPHNIVRTCCEFALEEQGACEVYVGTPAEVVATACARVRPSVDAVTLARLASLDGLPVLERLGAAADAAELAEVATSLGLSVSVRTARRVLTGEIAPLRSVHAVLTHPDRRHRRAVDLERDRRGLSLAPDDVRHFCRLMRHDFSYLADRYYLRLSSEPQVRVGGGHLTITFDIESDD